MAFGWLSFSHNVGRICGSDLDLPNVGRISLSIA